MSGERASLAAGGGGVVRGSRSRSYGSLVRSPRSPVRQRRIEHKLQPGETLQGLALKYGVSMEHIKRANRLYTNESIFVKSSLLIPVLSDFKDCSNGMDVAAGGDTGCASPPSASPPSASPPSASPPSASPPSASPPSASPPSAYTGSPPEAKHDDGAGMRSDLTPADFLQRLDALISRSTQAAVKGCQEAERRVAALEAACSSRTSALQPVRRSHSVPSASRMQEHQAAHGAVPLTITKLTKNLRDQEDDIFEL